MTTLHLIRHGKATPAKESYDELHPVGENQARLLGSYFAERRQHFDAIYCGPLRRQRDTQRLMRESAGELGQGWPAVIELEALAEAPIEAVMRKCLPDRLVHDSKLQALVSALGDGSDKAKMRVGFEAVFEYVIELWANGELTRPDIETAAEFGRRVVAGLEQILAREGEGREVAVITSNGVIGRLAAHVAGWSDPEARGPAQRYINTSRTLVTLARGELRVTAANVVDHLPDAELHTFI